MSTTHPFPAKKDNNFERQKDFIKERKKKKDQNEVEKKIVFTFAKLNVPPTITTFSDDDFIYVTFLSDRGGILKLKADFHGEEKKEEKIL